MRVKPSRRRLQNRPAARFFAGSTGARRRSTSPGARPISSIRARCPSTARGSSTSPASCVVGSRSLTLASVGRASQLGHADDLLRLLDDPDPRLRALALGALAASPPAAARLDDVLEASNDSLWLLRVEAFEVLGAWRLRDPRVLERLAGALDDPNGAARAAAAGKALEDLGLVEESGD